MTQQKNDMNMMLFAERIPLDSKKQVDENLFEVAKVSKEVKETK